MRASSISLTLIVAFWACSRMLKPSESENPDVRDVRVSDSAVCSQCPLELHVVGTAGTDSQAPRPVIGSGVVLLDSGQIAIGPVTTEGILAIYRDNGRLLRTIAIPVRGDEPQLQGLDTDGRFHITSGNTVVVLDTDGQEVRRVRLPMVPLRWLPLRGGAAVMIHPGRAAQMLVRFVTATGQIGTEFGAESVSPPAGETSLGRVIASASNGGVWVASPSRNTIELYDSTGAFIQRVTRASPSFDGLSGVNGDPDSSGELGAARLVSVFEDSSGMLWTLTTIPTSQLRLSDAHRISLRELFTDKGELLSTRVEVIDPRTGQLLRSATCRGWLMQLLGVATIGTFRNPSEEGVQVHVLRASWGRGDPDAARAGVTSTAARPREVCTPTNYSVSAREAAPLAIGYPAG
jgi:hypothetical protein